MRISDWSSDVCSSDLEEEFGDGLTYRDTVDAIVPQSDQIEDVAENNRRSRADHLFAAIARELQRIHEMMPVGRSEEHTSELQSLMRISYAVFCLKKKKKHTK